MGLRPEVLRAKTLELAMVMFAIGLDPDVAVARGAIMSAIRVTGRGLKDQQIVFLGGGSAAIGVADSLREAMEAEGLTRAEAVSRFFVVDKDGLLHAGRTDLTREQRLYAQPAGRIAGGGLGLADVIGSANATILIGLSTACGAFTENIVREMARKTERPVIFPLSNPTERCEAKAEDLIRWTDGRALVATGSPFAPASRCRPMPKRIGVSRPALTSRMREIALRVGPKPIERSAGA